MVIKRLCLIHSGTWKRENWHDYHNKWSHFALALSVESICLFVRFNIRIGNAQGRHSFCSSTHTHIDCRRFLCLNHAQQTASSKKVPKKIDKIKFTCPTQLYAAVHRHSQEYYFKYIEALKCIHSSREFWLAHLKGSHHMHRERRFSHRRFCFLCVCERENQQQTEKMQMCVRRWSFPTVINGTSQFTVGGRSCDSRVLTIHF